MAKIVRAKKPKPAKPKPAAVIVTARTPAQIKKAARLKVLRERGY